MSLSKFWNARNHFPNRTELPRESPVRSLYIFLIHATFSDLLGWSKIDRKIFPRKNRDQEKFKFICTRKYIKLTHQIDLLCSKNFWFLGPELSSRLSTNSKSRPQRQIFGQLRLVPFYTEFPKKLKRDQYMLETKF